MGPGGKGHNRNQPEGWRDTDLSSRRCKRDEEMGSEDKGLFVVSEVSGKSNSPEGRVLGVTREPEHSLAGRRCLWCYSGRGTKAESFCTHLLEGVLPAKAGLASAAGKHFSKAQGISAENADRKNTLSCEPDLK